MFKKRKEEFLIINLIVFTFSLIFGCKPFLNRTGSEEFLLNHFSIEKEDTAKLTKSNPIESSSPQEYNIISKIEKGPFLEGSLVTITELDASFNKTKKVHTSKTDKTGSFSYQGTFFSTRILIEATGKYFNEVADKNSSQPITLKTIMQLQANQNSKKTVTANVNTLTTLQTDRQIQLVKSGKFSFSEAKKIAKKEVASVFGLDTSKIDKPFHQIELAKEPELIRISAILQGKQDDARKVQKLIQSVAEGIAKKGKIEDKTIVQELQNNEKHIKDNVKYDKIVDNLKKKYPKFKQESKINTKQIEKSQVDPAGGASSVGKVKTTRNIDQEKIDNFIDDDIKKWDSINTDPNNLPSSIADPNFNIPNSYKALNNFSIELVPNSVKKIDGTGTYVYQVKVSNADETAFKNITVQYDNFLTTDKNVLLNIFTASDIQAWDDIQVKNDTLPSSLGEPNFNPPANYKGLKNFIVKLVTGSVQKISETGTYQYQAKVTNTDKTLSKTFDIQYHGFATISDFLNKFTADDIKQWDSINETSSVAATLGNPNFANLPKTYKGLTDFTVTFAPSSINKENLNGIYRYDAVIEKNTVTKTFTVTYDGFKKVVITHFSKMEDANQKAYGFSVLRIDSSITLNSHDTRGTCSTVADTLLISSDNFVNCDAVYVQKLKDKNHVIIPRKSWALNTIYKVGIRLAVNGTIHQLPLNNAFIVFATNNLNYSTSGGSGGLVASLNVGNSPFYRNNFYLENDGEIWFYLYYGTKFKPASSTRCKNYINYTNSSGKKPIPLSSSVSADRELARTVFSPLANRSGLDDSDFYYKFFYVTATQWGNFHQFRRFTFPTGKGGAALTISHSSFSFKVLKKTIIGLAELCFFKPALRN